MAELKLNAEKTPNEKNVKIRFIIKRRQPNNFTLDIPKI